MFSVFCTGGGGGEMLNVAMKKTGIKWQGSRDETETIGVSMGGYRCALLGWVKCNCETGRRQA